MSFQLDSNLLIYASKPEYPALRLQIAEWLPAVSAVTYVEALGYHRLNDAERRFLEAFFVQAPVLQLSQDILDEAVRLRQARKMGSGDALIAGTALTYGLTLITRNAADFSWIAGLSVLDPLAST